MTPSRLTRRLARSLCALAASACILLAIAAAADRASRRHVAPARRAQQPGPDRRQGDRPAARQRRPRHDRARADRHRRGAPRCSAPATSAPASRPGRTSAPAPPTASAETATARQLARSRGRTAPEPQHDPARVRQLAGGSRGPPAPGRALQDISSRLEVPTNNSGGPMHRPMTPTARRGIAVLLGVAALCAMIAPALARADTVTDWNGYASTAIVVNAGQPPPVAVLSFAMVQGAVYDAVNAIDRGHRPYLAEPPASPSDSKDAAAATAAFRVLVGLFPTQQSTLQPLYDTSLAAVAGHATRREGGRHRHRRGGGGGDARRPSGRRALRPVHPRGRDDAGRLAPNAAALRRRPRSLGRKRPAVPGPRRRDASHRRAPTP